MASKKNTFLFAIAYSAVRVDGKVYEDQRLLQIPSNYKTAKFLGDQEEDESNICVTYHLNNNHKSKEIKHTFGAVRDFVVWRDKHNLICENQHIANLLSAATGTQLTAEDYIAWMGDVEGSDGYNPNKGSYHKFHRAVQQLLSKEVTEELEQIARLDCVLTALLFRMKKAELGGYSIAKIRADKRIPKASRKFLSVGA